jgi:DNA gyrase subunit A
MGMSGRNNAVAATFPVQDSQDIMLVTDGGQIIRMPVHDIRIAGRSTQGVTLFRVAEGETVVSVAALEDEGEAGVEE